jgi:hypothetical protein
MLRSPSHRDSHAHASASGCSRSARYRLAAFLVLATVLLMAWGAFLAISARRATRLEQSGFPPDLRRSASSLAARLLKSQLGGRRSSGHNVAEPEEEEEEEEQVIPDSAAVAAAFDQTVKVINPAGAVPPSSPERPVSVVIVNYQEPLLPATVNEILRTSSQELISEILIIDDFSHPPVPIRNLTCTLPRRIFCI